MSLGPRCKALVILALLQPLTHTDTHTNQSSVPLLALSHLNSLVRPYLAFLLALLSHDYDPYDCPHRKKCAETQRLTANGAHEIAFFPLSLHSSNAIFALFFGVSSLFISNQPTLFVVFKFVWSDESLSLSLQFSVGVVIVTLLGAPPH